MESNDPRKPAATQPNESGAEQKFARRISCAPPSEAPRYAAPLRPGAHGVGQRPSGGDGR
jgi:hypothetical protein